MFRFMKNAMMNAIIFSNTKAMKKEKKMLLVAR